MIQLLLAAGADVNARDGVGRTPLHYVAAQSENAVEVTLLLAAGADPKARDRNCATPLHAAAQGSGKPKLFRALVEAGADINAGDYYGRTALKYAAANTGNPAAYRALRGLFGANKRAQQRALDDAACGGAGGDCPSSEDAARCGR